MKIRLLEGATLLALGMGGVAFLARDREAGAVQAGDVQDDIAEEKESHEADLLGGPWLEWPFETGVGRVYQAYGQAERGDPTQVHTGLDIAAPVGTPVYSPLSGEVSMNFGNAYADFQQGIAIRGFYGGHEIFVKLLHLDRASIQVLLGDRVRAGDFIGFVAEWDGPEAYEAHLHVEIGGASLYAKMKQRPDGVQLSPRDAFAPLKDPLAWMHRPVDEIEPTLVPLSSTDDIVFRRFRERSGFNDNVPGEQLDSNELTGLVDVEFGIRDRFSKDDPTVLMPNQIRLRILKDDPERDEVFHRYLILDGPLEITNMYSHCIYLAPPAEWPEHHAFHLRLLSLRGLGGEGLDPEPWDTTSCEPGSYILRFEASDSHHRNALLGEYPVRVVAQ